MNMLPLILIQVILIALNAVFACAEIAVLSFNENKLQKMAEDGNKKARRLARLTKQPANFLATIQVAITLSGFLGSAFAAENFADPIVNAILSTGIAIDKGILNTLVVILITIVLSYFTLVFGELVPKRVAMRRAEGVSLTLSGPLTFVAKFFYPLVWLLTASTNLILRMMGIDPDKNDEEVSEEDILLMVDAGNQTGAIDKTEHEIIQNVFGFDDLTAGEIATHRTDVAMLWAEDGFDAWDETVHTNRYTFYPICRESQDNVIGILNAKDYFRIDPAKRDKRLVMRDAVKPPYFVPEGVKADVLLQNMRKTHNKFAVVIDEYGGMAGIITITDLIERLVGDISDDDAEQPNSGKTDEIELLEENLYRVPGTASIEDVEKALSVEISDEDSDTFGGFVFAALGSIPPDGSTPEIQIDRLFVKVTDVEDHQMISSVVRVEPKEDEDEKEAKKEKDKDKDEDDD